MSLRIPLVGWTRILRKYGYPPHKQEAAPRTVLEQAELLSELWVGTQAGGGTAP